jgi:hypothetical protein
MAAKTERCEEKRAEFSRREIGKEMSPTDPPTKLLDIVML